MKRIFKTFATLFFVVFCVKYLFADSLRMDYCKNTEYYDKNSYEGTEFRYKVISETVNGVAVPDSVVKSKGFVSYVSGLPNKDTSAIQYITTDGGYTRFKRER